LEPLVVTLLREAILPRDSPVILPKVILPRDSPVIPLQEVIHHKEAIHLRVDIRQPVAHLMARLVTSLLKVAILPSKATHLKVVILHKEDTRPRGAIHLREATHHKEDTRRRVAIPLREAIRHKGGTHHREVIHHPTELCDTAAK